MINVTLQSQIRDNAIMRELTDECSNCKGFGETHSTRRQMLPFHEINSIINKLEKTGKVRKGQIPKRGPLKFVPKGQSSEITITLRTWYMGSACSVCHGTGRVER